MFQAQVKPETVTPLSEMLIINLPLYFKDTSNIQVFRGTFNPQNNYQYIFQNLPPEQAPNFLIAVTDAQLNLSAGLIQNLPIIRFGFFSWALDPANLMTSLYIEGRANFPSPMVQGTPVNYTLVAGRGTVF